MEYHPIVIRDVIKGINKDYYLPAIQREFIWTTEKIEKLFDSIMGDFPIGSFLFWKVKEEKKHDWIIYEFIRNFDKEAPHNEEADVNGINRDIFLVLDGQQRLTSLYLGLKGSYRYFYYRWRTSRLYLNLLKHPVPNEDDPQELTYQFEFRENTSSDNQGKELWYEVGRILDYEDAEDAKADIKEIVSNLDNDLQQNANKLIGRLHTKIHTVLTINYYEEKSQDYDKVLNIFVRANSGGVPLEYSDLLLSTATAKWNNLNARDEINNFTDQINSIGTEYNFGKDFILKGALYLTEDLPIQYKVKNFNRRNLLKIEDNWEIIKTYISMTVRLASKYGITLKNLVAPNALLPIAFFLMKRGNTSFEQSSEINDVENQVRIRKWLILALLKNAFGGSSDTTLRNIREILLKESPLTVFPIEELLNYSEIELGFSDSEIERILGYMYQGKYTFLILSLLYPDRDWKGMVFHEDHIYPKSEFTAAKLRRRGYDTTKIAAYLSRYNTIANLQLITDTENLSKSSKPFEKWLLTMDSSFMERHHIPEMSSYEFDLFEEFIEARKVKIIKVLKSL
jgi:uncharacterized protein with ParB-like and HNH nuclease domain